MVASLTQPIGRRVHIAFLFICCWVAVAGNAPAENVDASQPNDKTEDVTSDLRYYRVLIPKDRLDDFGVGWFPLETKRFNELLKIASDAQDPLRQQRVSIKSAIYRGSLTDNSLLSGTVDFTVESQNERPAPLWLGDSNLVLRNPQFETETPVNFGTAPDGRTFLMVTGSGRVRAEWKLATQKDSVQMRFPPAQQTTLQVETPAGLMLHSEPGIVTESVDSNRWRIQLGGIQATKLSWEPKLSIINLSLVQFNKSTRYHISPRGVELAIQLRISSSNEPLRRFDLNIPTETQLLSASFGGKPLRWQPASDGGSVRFELPEPIDEEERIVDLVAVAPLQLNELGRLPTVQPRNMSWQGGTVSVEVEEPIAVKTTHGQQLPPNFGATIASAQPG